MDLFDDPPDRESKPKAATIPPPEMKKVVVDLAEVPPEKREQLAANAEIAGFEVKNKHLLDEMRQAKREPKQALLMEFPTNPPSEVQGMTPLFRLSRQRDLDILFAGLNIGPVFQDAVELAVKNKFLKGSSEAEMATKHFVVFVYLAIALPFGQSEDTMMDCGWSLTWMAPRQFERIMPKALRERLWHRYMVQAGWQPL